MGAGTGTGDDGAAVLAFTGGSGNGAGAAAGATTAGATGLCPETTLGGIDRCRMAKTIKAHAARSSKTMKIPSGQCPRGSASAGRTGVSGGTFAVESRWCFRAFLRASLMRLTRGYFLPVPGWPAPPC